jgi:predicted DNA-binding protein with PD1-like motif
MFGHQNRMAQVRSSPASLLFRTLEHGGLEDVLILSLIGDVAQGDDGNSSLHLHAVVGLQDGTLRGGHFLSGLVQPTLEVTIRETVAHLHRKKRADLGIALISI